MFMGCLHRNIVATLCLLMVVQKRILYKSQFKSRKRLSGIFFFFFLSQPLSIDISDYFGCHGHASLYLPQCCCFSVAAGAAVLLQ
jgi:hypothetical protein